MPKTQTPTDPLTLTGEQVAAIVTDAQALADQAAQALADAVADPATVTPARYTELRQEAEHAALLVPAAERRQAEVRDAQAQAHHAETLARVRAEAADDLGGADDLIAKLDAYEAALRTFCEAALAHNERITHWARQMGQSGIGVRGIPYEGGGQLSFAPDGTELTIGHKKYRHIVGGKLVGSTLYRVMRDYPRNFLRYFGGLPITHWGDELAPRNEPLDLHDLIRKDA